MLNVPIKIEAIIFVSSSKISTTTINHICQYVINKESHETQLILMDKSASRKFAEIVAGLNVYKIKVTALSIPEKLHKFLQVKETNIDFFRDCIILPGTLFVVGEDDLLNTGINIIIGKLDSIDNVYLKKVFPSFTLYEREK